MSDRRSPLDFYAPVDTATLPRDQTPRPVETPSLWTQFSTAAMGAAVNDDPAADDARKLAAVNDALTPIIADLQHRGIAGDYVQYKASDGWARSYNEDAIWRGVARARALDPKAFADVEATPEAFHKRATAKITAEIAGEHEVQQRSSWVPWLAGQFAGGLSDPINQAALLVGGGPARSIAQAALRDAAINTQIELAQEPVKAIAQAKRGQDFTPGQFVQDLGIAAGTGAVAGAVLHPIGEAVGAALARRKTPSGDLADQMRAVVGTDRMTDAEKAATSTLDRIDQVSANSPFQPGAGTDAHLGRMDRTMAAIDQPGPIAAEATPPAAPRFDFTEYSNRVGVRESGGSWTRQAEGSSAYGMYQITRGTFIRQARKDPRLAGMSDDAIWDRRTNPAMQEGIFNRITQDNRAALARIGAPETYGNLYLMHFAGEGAGARILRAAPETPIEELMSREAIAANKFLKGKTAEDVVAWAHHAVGDTPHGGPVLRRDDFADDGEWADAQREVDAAEAQVRQAETEAPAASPRDPEPWDDIPMPGFDEPAIARDIPATGTDWEPAAIDGATPAQPAPDTAWIDAPSIDDPVAAGGGPSEGQKVTLTQDRLDALRSAGETEVARQAPAARMAPRAPTEAEDTLRMKWARAAGAGKEAAPVWAMRRRDTGEIEAWTARKPDILAKLDREWEPEHFEIAQVTPADLPEAPAAQHVPVTDASAVADVPDAPMWGDHAPDLHGFDTPVDTGAEAMTDSLEHDVRMMLATDEGAAMTVQLDANGEPVSARAALKEADDDEAAVEAARRCMAPAKGEAA